MGGYLAKSGRPINPTEAEREDESISEDQCCQTTSEGKHDNGETSGKGKKWYRNDALALQRHGISNTPEGDMNQ